GPSHRLATRRDAELAARPLPVPDDSLARTRGPFSHRAPRDRRRRRERRLGRGRAGGPRPPHQRRRRAARSTPPMASPPDRAHIHHAELLTTRPEESLRFFVDVLGMEIEAQAAGSAYLRGWGDSQRYSLKLTESAQTGLGHVAIRAWSDDALQRVVRAI